MADRASILVAGFVPARSHHVDPHLLGFVRVVVADLVVLDGIALRRRPDGTLELRFPSRVDHWGTRHALVHPFDAAARAAIERAVFDAIGITAARGGAS